MSVANDEFFGTKLRAVISALRDDLKPELTSAQAKMRAELMDMLLSRLSVYADGGDAGELYWDELTDVQADIASGEAAERRAALSTYLGEQQNDSSAAIAKIAASEGKRRSAYENAVTQALTATPDGKSSAEELSISAETFTAYLRQHFPEDPSLNVEKVVTVPGGRSKGTILLDISTKDGPRQIVIRRDFSASVTGTSVSYEYPIVEAAFKAGLKVPEPLWLEDSTEAIGGRFIGFERVMGKAMGSLFESDASPEFTKKFAAALAQLHGINVDDGGLAAKMRYGQADHPVRAMINDFYDRYTKNMRPNPLLDAAFAWLRLQLDAIGNERVLVHGDAGLHNTMGDGDTLTALLDWEFAHVGDPAEDLTYCKYLIEKILPWNDFMAAYLAAGGRPVSEARMRFFTIWRTLHLSILTGLAVEMFESGKDQDLRIAAIGFNTFPKQLRDLANDLANFTGADIK